MIYTKTRFNKVAALGILSLLSACSAEFDSAVSNAGSSGDADFSKFVAIGDSLTAGYADGALYLAGQENSYPAILAQQFARVGGGTFEQPLVSDNLGGLLFGGMENPNFANRLVLNATDPENPSPEPIAGTPTTEVFSALTGMFNNMGVPGAKSYHLGAPGYGDPAGVVAVPATANPYYARFATSAATTVITDAAAQAPSFYVLWIGNNDILSYATAGGDGVDQTGNFDPTTYGSDDITDPVVFGGTYTQLVGAMTLANPNVQGVLVNIPEVSSIPFFTTVPYNAVPLDQATADALNAGFAAYNAGVASLLGVISADEVQQRTITYSAGQNPVLIEDEDLTDLTGFNAGLINMRQATAEDLIVLTASTKIGELANPADPTTAWGVSVPLEDADVLIPSEVAAIETARTAYNVAILATADADPNLVFYDAAADLQALSEEGISFGTGQIDDIYATGGGFSLDGVHPTARGYAVVANGIIDVINTGFNASVPKVDPGTYTTIFFQ